MILFRLGQRLAVDQRHDGEVQCQADQGNRGKSRCESQIRNMRERSYDDVLRVTGDRGNRADIRGRRQADQVRDRRPLQALTEVEYKRSQRDADDVVDKERRESARNGDRHGQEAQRPRASGGDLFRRQREETSHAEVRHDDHHAEEQDNCFIVHGPGRVTHREHAAGEHDGRAHQSDPRSVDSQAGNLADGQGQVSQTEDRRNQGD